MFTFHMIEIKEALSDQFVSLLDIRNFIFFTFYNGVRYLLRWFALDIVDMIN